MADAAKPPKPRNYFLNEQHELVPGERDGGGGTPKYTGIDWKKKGQHIHTSLESVKKQVAGLRDPLKERRYFMMTMPAPVVAKVSTNKKIAPDGIKKEATKYGGAHSKIFGRLGMDLLQVNADGSALVHATPDKIESLLASSDTLGEMGVREQAKWATIDKFAPIPEKLKVDSDWLKTLPKDKTVEAIIELQPLLTGVEADEVLRVLAAILKKDAKERMLGAGTDFSGRQWSRGNVTKESLALIAREFISVQSLHQPLTTLVASAAPARSARAPLVTGTRSTSSPQTLPTVAVLDTGIPTGHAELAPYLRGQVIEQNAQQSPLGHHGSFVASRVVFGDPDFSGGVGNAPPAGCRVLDVLVARDADSLEDKSIVRAMETVVAAYRDVRVFNLSFGDYRSLESLNEVERKEKLAQLRELDNFAFANDVVIVVSAGNSRPGVVPNPQYPEHYDVPEWALGSWARGYNTLTCGALVGRLQTSGLIRQVGWPSPFTRARPKDLSAPIPGFGANGGNASETYQWTGGLGVWGTNANGNWEDRCGTSFAAPLLAREAAFAFDRLRAYCEGDVRPFASTVKAFLALTAEHVGEIKKVKKLAGRTIGRGVASAERVGSPLQNSAVVIWQGTISTKDELVRVKLPIPSDWLKKATAPELRLIWAWDTPVNDAVPDIWGCRSVEAHLKATIDQDAMRGSGRACPGYPLVERIFNLSAGHLAEQGVKPGDDHWIVELSYKELAEYYVGIDFSPVQRVSFAAELVDRAEEPVSPQAFMQALPISNTLNRFAVHAAKMPAPVVIKSRR